MLLVDSSITKEELQKLAKTKFGNLIKAVVDVDREMMVVDASLHSDEEAFLLSKGSDQKNLWGINLYPELVGEDFIEFDSMINLRPHQNNNTRGVDDKNTQLKIRKVVEKLVN